MALKVPAEGGKDLESTDRECGVETSTWFSSFRFTNAECTFVIAATSCEEYTPVGSVVSTSLPTEIALMSVAGM